VGRDDDIEAIVEIGRRTRKPTPRWMWIAATLVGAICATGFAVGVLGYREPQGEPPDHRPSHRPSHVDGRPAASSGLGIGLVIGAAAGLVVGFSIARQRRSHSSRNNP
jgi:drug/metabolite transporter (DMT)-like permease